MLFKRILATDQAGLPQVSRAGLGIAALISTMIISADANATLTVDNIAGGAVQFTGFTAGRTITTPTAAAMAAACPDMDIGDSFTIAVSVVPAFAGTWVAGTGVTLAGRATTPASSYSLVVVTRTGASAFTWNVL